MAKLTDSNAIMTVLAVLKGIVHRMEDADLTDKKKLKSISKYIYEAANEIVGAECYDTKHAELEVGVTMGGERKLVRFTFWA